MRRERAQERLEEPSASRGTRCSPPGHMYMHFYLHHEHIITIDQVFDRVKSLHHCRL